MCNVDKRLLVVLQSLLSNVTWPTVATSTLRAQYNNYVQNTRSSILKVLHEHTAIARETLIGGKDDQVCNPPRPCSQNTTNGYQHKEQHEDNEESTSCEHNI